MVNTDSLAEQLQRAFPDLRVVTSLNTMTAAVMVDPTRLPEAHHVFVAGDDDEAKATVSDLLQATVAGQRGLQRQDRQGLTARRPRSSQGRDRFVADRVQEPSAP